MSDNNGSIIEEAPDYIELHDNESTEKIEIVTKENVVAPKQEKKVSKRVYWVDCLRIFASYIVVVTHASCYNIKRKYNSWEFHVALTYHGSTRACVPFFIMISGIFFLKPTKKITYKQIFTKYVFRILKCYIFWSIFYSLVYYHFIYNEFNIFKDREILTDVIKKSLLGTDHLWYLNFVMGLYITTPIFRAITADRSLAIYTVIISSIAFQIVPTIVHLISFFFDFQEISMLKEFFDKLLFEMAGSYSVYYILGYLLSTYEFKKKRNIYLMYLVGFLGTFLTSFFYLYESIKKKKIEGSMINFFCFPVVMSTIGGFIFFKYAVNDFIQPLIEKPWVVKTINVLSECSFGVYLWHLFILGVLSIFLGTNGSTIFGIPINTIFGIPIDTTITYIISFILTYIMRKIPYIRVLV